MLIWYVHGVQSILVYYIAIPRRRLLIRGAICVLICIKLVLRDRDHAAHSDAKINRETEHRKSAPSG